MLMGQILLIFHVIVSRNFSTRLALTMNYANLELPNIDQIEHMKYLSSRNFCFLGISIL